MSLLGGMAGLPNGPSSLDHIEINEERKRKLEVSDRSLTHHHTPHHTHTHTHTRPAQIAH
jgi:hypothetical protein